MYSVTPSHTSKAQSPTRPSTESMSTAMGGGSTFEDQGIQFKVITPDMHQEVMDFLWTHLFPAEPVSRSLGVRRLGFLDKYVFPDAFRQNCSMVALDREGHLLAVRVGHIKRKSDWSAWMLDQVFSYIPYKFLSRWWPSLEKVPILVHLLRTIDYYVWNKFEAWNCQSVYEVIFDGPFDNSHNIPVAGPGGLFCPDSRGARSGHGDCQAL